jgi:hypothetical protein
MHRPQRPGNGEDRAAEQVEGLDHGWVVKGHPWLIDPAWSEADRQATYTKLLRECAEEPKNLDENDRRLDLLIRTGGGITIVELKKPQKKLSREDLEQIERYVDWARENILGGTGADAPKYVKGLLLVGEVNPKLKDKSVRLAGDDIRVEVFTDLRDRAKEYYGEVERQLGKIAPEYLKARKKAT